MTDDTDKEPTQSMDESRPPALTIDWALYETYLEDSDLSEEDKRAFIEALWSIMVRFVDMGFRLSPVQEICGEISPLDALTGKAASDMVRSKDTNNAFEKAADGHALPSLEKESAP